MKKSIAPIRTLLLALAGAALLVLSAAGCTSTTTDHPGPHYGDQGNQRADGKDSRPRVRHPGPHN